MPLVEKSSFCFRKAPEEDPSSSALSALVTSASSLSVTTTSQMIEKRFAYTLLEKLLEYVERASSTMQNYKESSKFSLHESYRMSTKDVKFFGKVSDVESDASLSCRPRRS